MRTTGLLAVAAIILVLAAAGGAAFYFLHDAGPTEPPPAAPAEGEEAAPADTETTPEEAPPPASKALISGVVHDADGNAMADLKLAYWSNPRYVLYTRTNAAGEFSIPNLEPEIYTLSAVPPEKLADEEGLSYKLRNPEIEVTGGDVTGLELVVEVIAPAIIRGIVIDEAEKPLGNTALRCAAAVVQEVVSGGDGGFIFEFEQHEGLVDIYLTRGNYGESMVEGVEIGTRDLSIIIERGGTLVGKVIVGATRKPVTDFQLFIEPADISSNEFAVPEFEQVFSDPGGRCTFEGLVPMKTRLSVVADGFARTTHEVDIVNGKAHNLLFELGEEKALRGIVIDGDTKQPVVDARIYLEKLPDIEYDSTHIAQTDAHGAFRIENLPDGSVQLGIAPKHDYPPRVVTVDSTKSPVTIEFQKAALFHGYVLYGGEPVPNAPVTVHTKRDDGSLLIRRKRTDENGYFSFSTLPPGSYTTEAANPLNPDDLFRRKRIVMTEGFEIRQDFEF